MASFELQRSVSTYISNDKESILQVSSFIFSEKLTGQSLAVGYQYLFRPNICASFK